MTASPTPIEYQSPRVRLLAPPPAALFWISAIMSAVAGIVGVGIFLGYLVSHEEGFAVAGFVWLYLGGFLTFIAGVLALVYGGIAISRRFAGRGSIRRSIIAFVLPFLNLVLAFICAGVGLNMLSSGWHSSSYSTYTTMPTTQPTTEPTVSDVATTQPAAISEAAESMRKLGKRDIGAHDPSTIVRDGDAYYCFVTGQGIHVIRSNDLQTWTPQPRVFEHSPDWVTTAVPGNRGTFWAPDIIRAKDGRWLLYYSVSTFGKQTSVIALATNSTLDASNPAYAWKDAGIVQKSSPADHFNAIDPSVSFDADGRLWMVFGSYWDGIKLIELDPATGLRKGDDAPIALARNHQIEASFIYHHDNHYYLFVNWGSCCQGVKSTYEIRVGRADKITGPYLDREGKDLAQNGGTLFLAGEGAMFGPGHAGIVTDADGHEQFSFHFYDGTDEGKPKLGIRPLMWDTEGWPVANERD